MTNQTDAQAKAGAVIIPVTLFQQNCMLLWEEATKKAVVIDPGGDVPQIQAAIAQAGVIVEQIWITHGHIDHVGGAAELRDLLKVKVTGPHIADRHYFNLIEDSGARFGMTGMRNFMPDSWLEEGDRVSIGELSFDILHCPGHSPGSVVYFNKADALRPCRRRTVQWLGRPHRPSRWRSRHPDQVHHRQAAAAW